MVGVSAPPVIVAVGCLTLDVAHLVDRVPGRNEKTVGLAQTLTFGGPAANAAATAAALGARVHLVAPFGRCAVTELVAAQLATAGVTWHDPSAGLTNPSPISSLLVDRATGERAVISGGVMDVADDARLPEGLVESADAVLVDGHAMPLARQAARTAAAHGVPVVLDGGSYKRDLERLLADVDLAILSADFVAPGGADPLPWTLAHGARYAAQSAGAGPLRTVGGVLVPVPTVRAVDTAGAGDVLHGAAVAALGRLGVRPARVPASAPVALRFAVDVATASVRFPGPRGWIEDPAAAAAMVAAYRRLGE